MDAPAHQAAQPDASRRAVHALAALSTLHAAWDGLDPVAILDSLSSVLLETLDLDGAYARLSAAGTSETIDATRSVPADAASAFQPLLGALLDDAAPTDAPATMPAAHPVDGQALRVHVLRFGIADDRGAIAVASRRADFPTEDERLLLGVGVNQAAVVLRQRLAEQALARSEARFLDFADTAPAMLWVTEPDGYCSFLSRGWYAFTGQTEEEGLGLGWTNAVHPGDQERTRRAFLDANAARREFGLEHRIRHVDGSYRWVIDMGRPRLSPAGEFLGFVGNVLDIHDRKQAEQALRRTQDMLATVFEALPVGVAVIDRDGRVLLSNQDMRQYLPTNVLPSLDDARYTRWHALHPDGRPYAREEFPGARALRGERVVPGVEARYTSDDGTEIWTQVAAVPLADSDGAPNGQVSIVTNIDAFKRTEAALRQAESNGRALLDEVTKSNKNLSEFLAVLAHELRNPLAPIVTGLEVMRMRADSPDTIASVRGIIERQTRQLAHLIDDLLDIARVTNGKVDIKKQFTDLGTVVAHAVETSMPAIEKNRHAFTLTLPDLPLPVHVDPARISQVVGNLLTNAAKYTPPGGKLALAVTREANRARIAVSDNGIGIPSESLESVFDMFSQVGRNMAHSQGGLGIGLSLVRQLVNLHGGAVSASSAGTGKGSCFVVTLPLVDMPEPGHADATTGSLGTTPGRRLRILVTDDNVDAATMLASLLETLGHDPQVAHDGATALRAAAQWLPDVVFLDIGMPGMNGYEVARSLRALPGLEHSRLVAVSGWGAKEDVARSVQAGFDLHLTKPVVPARISEFLGSLR